MPPPTPGIPPIPVPSVLPSRHAGSIEAELSDRSIQSSSSTPSSSCENMDGMTTNRLCSSLSRISTKLITSGFNSKITSFLCSIGESLDRRLLLAAMPPTSALMTSVTKLSGDLERCSPRPPCV